MNRTLARLGRSLAHYLQKPVVSGRSISTTPSDRLRATLRPCDVLLVEGKTRISTAIKYLTQSTWSHAAFFAGADDPASAFIEADLEYGVRSVPVETYSGLATRICRPVGLSQSDAQAIVEFMRNSVGKTYDLKNIIDLARYLLPTPPVPTRFRRRMLALGSGDPTQAICSSLIAQGFQSVRYPILPQIVEGCDIEDARLILHIRHHSLFVPRDFDLSPYFEVVKPSLSPKFDYRALTWDGHPPLSADEATLASETAAREKEA